MLFIDDSKLDIYIAAWIHDPACQQQRIMDNGFQDMGDASNLTARKIGVAIKDSAQITWPAILIQEGQAELLFLESQANWIVESQGYIEDASRLVDSSGRCYVREQQSWKGSTQTMPLNELVELIRHHASTMGHCCTAKIGARSLEQAFEIMEYLETDP